MNGIGEGENEDEGEITRNSFYKCCHDKTEESNHY